MNYNQIIFINYTFNWEDVLNLIKVSNFTNNLKFTFKSLLMVFMFVWLNRAGCKESGGVNIVAYF